MREKINRFSKYVRFIILAFLTQFFEWTEMIEADALHNVR